MERENEERGGSDRVRNGWREEREPKLEMDGESERERQG